MKKFLILGLIPLLLMVPGTAFADDFILETECVEGYWTLTVFGDEDNEPVSGVTVRTGNNPDQKFMTNENGVVKLSPEENNGSVSITKSGYNTKNILTEKCFLPKSNFNTEIVFHYDTDFICEFENQYPIGIRIDGDIQNNGLVKITSDIDLESLQNYDIDEEFFIELIEYGYGSYQEFYVSEQTRSINFCHTTHPVEIPELKLNWITVTNGDTSERFLWEKSMSRDLEEEFRQLQAPEKEYTESMNVLGKVIRIFDDKICVEEYCKQGDQLPVHVEGNIGINTKDSIKLQIIHCDRNYLLYCVDFPGLENLVIGEINAENRDGGNFYADWTIRKTAIEGLYQVKGMTDGRVVGEVGNSMMDIINGLYNDKVIVLSNITPVEYTSVTENDVKITILDMDYGYTGGTVHYELCAKHDLSNPSFGIISDVDRKQIGIEIELAEDECIKGKYTITAKAPSTILVPLATEKSASSDEIDALKEELAELRKMLEDKPKVPGWVKNNVQWWANGQVDDATFINGIEFMVKEKVINIPDLPPQASETAEQKIPDWIRNNAIWWSEGAISEDDFVNGIEFLVQNGIIQVQ